MERDRLPLVANSLPVPGWAGVSDLAFSLSQCQCEQHPSAPGWAGGNSSSGGPTNIFRQVQSPPAPSWAGSQPAPGPSFTDGSQIRTPSAPRRAGDRFHPPAGPSNVTSRAVCAPSAPGRMGVGLSAFADTLPPPLRAHRCPPAPSWAEDDRLPSIRPLGLAPPYAPSQAGGSGRTSATITRSRLPAPGRAGKSGSGSGLEAAPAPGQPARTSRCSCTCSASALGQGDYSGSVVGPLPLDLSVGRDGPVEHGPVGLHGAGRISLQPPRVVSDTDSPVGRPSSVMPPRISEYDCELIWGRSADDSVSGPEDRIASVVKSVLSSMGVSGVAPNSTPPPGGALWAVAPTGTHLPEETKEKIWRREFIDFLTLVPPDRETIDKSRRVDVSAQGEKPKQLLRTFGNWLQGLCAYAGVLCERFPELATSLLCYLDLIWGAYKVYGGQCWFQYDTQFRQKMAARKELRFDCQDGSLWLLLMCPHRPSSFQSAVGAPQSGALAASKKGIFFQ